MQTFIDSLHIAKIKNIDIIADILNNTLRQILGFKTPIKLFHAHLLQAPSWARDART